MHEPHTRRQWHCVRYWNRGSNAINKKWKLYAELKCMCNKKGKENDFTKYFTTRVTGNMGNDKKIELENGAYNRRKKLGSTTHTHTHTLQCARKEKACRRKKQIERIKIEVKKTTAFTRSQIWYDAGIMRAAFFELRFCKCILSLSSLFYLICLFVCINNKTTTPTRQ